MSQKKRPKTQSHFPLVYDDYLLISRISKTTSPPKNFFDIFNNFLTIVYTMVKIIIIEITKKTQLELWSKRKKPQGNY